MAEGGGQTALGGPGSGDFGGGTASSDYRAATEGVAAFPRPNRRFLRVEGKAPGEMLKGIVSGRIPEDPSGPGGLMAVGEVSYSALLTPKGKMISDLRIFRDPGNTFLLDLPEAGWPQALEHFKRFLPPRLARTVDRSEELGMLTLAGPGSAALVAHALATMGSDSHTARRAPRGNGPASKAAGAPSEAVSPSPEAVTHALEEMKEGEGVSIELSLGISARVTPNGDLRPPAFDLILPKPQVDEALKAALAAGAEPGSPATLDILRIENGRPAFGIDMTRDTIPVEAGIHGRAIDSEKGCYTGQEVIIRIRDRGQVNKNLRGFLLGDAEPPSTGSGLFLPSGGTQDGARKSKDGVGKCDTSVGAEGGAGQKSVGWITSSCESPFFGETIALGYVRRSAGGEEVLRVGGSEGTTARVRPLGSAGWG